MLSTLIWMLFSSLVATAFASISLPWLHWCLLGLFTSLQSTELALPKQGFTIINIKNQILQHGTCYAFCIPEQVLKAFWLDASKNTSGIGYPSKNPPSICNWGHKDYLDTLNLLVGTTKKKINALFLAIYYIGMVWNEPLNLSINFLS